MTTEVPPAQVRALAEALLSAAAEAATAAGVLTGERVGGPLQVVVDEHLAVARAALGAVAGELARLGGTIAAVADSWVGFDASVLPRPGNPPAR